MEPLTFIQAILLGLVEGLTEYLPISSTGHLIITEALLGLDMPPARKQAVDAFLIVIQGGAILAVLGLYRNRVIQMLRGLIGRDAPGRKLLINLFIAFLPAAVFGVLLNEWIQSRLFYPIPVMIALALGGVAMILLSPWQRRFFHEQDPKNTNDLHQFVDIEDLSWKQSLIIGLLQCIAMWPGMSRSMMTIMGGMMIGLRPKQAAEFSFLLGLPTLGGACVYTALRQFAGPDSTTLQSLGLWPLLVGLVVATIAAALAVKWLVGYLGRHGVGIFGWYRLILCAVLGGLILTGRLTFAPPPDSPPDSSSNNTSQISKTPVPLPLAPSDPNSSR